MEQNLADTSTQAGRQTQSQAAKHPAINGVQQAVTNYQQVTQGDMARLENIIKPLKTSPDRNAQSVSTQIEILMTQFNQHLNELQSQIDNYMHSIGQELGKQKENFA